MTLIDRDALMDKINNTMASYVDLIMDAPIIKIPKWTSVTERLPEERDGRVLVSTEDGEVTTGLHSEFSNVWYIGDMYGVGGSKVIAWMPLPEPYKGGEKDG